MRTALAAALLLALPALRAASARAAGAEPSDKKGQAASLEELCRELRRGSSLALPGRDLAAQLLARCKQPAAPLRTPGGKTAQSASPRMRAAQARVSAAARDPRWASALPEQAGGGTGLLAAHAWAGRSASAPRVTVRADYKPGYQRPAAAPPAPRRAATASAPRGPDSWSPLASLLRAWGAGRVASSEKITRENTGDSPAAWLRRKWLSLTGQAAQVDAVGVDPAGAAQALVKGLVADHRAARRAPPAPPGLERRLFIEHVRDQVSDPFTGGAFARYIGRPLARAVKRCAKDTSWWTCLDAGSEAVGDAAMLTPVGAGEAGAARLGVEAASGLGAAETAAAGTAALDLARAAGAERNAAARLARAAPLLPLQDQAALAARIRAAKPPPVHFVKDAPILGYRITSRIRNFDDLPAAIRRHIGSVDQTKYTESYLRENEGTIIALQMNGDKPDFYIIGKETFGTKYAHAPVGHVSAKNPKLVKGLSSVEGMSELLASNDPNVVGALKTVPVEMTRMSDAGYPVASEVKIASPWGEQVKPAGKDAYLVWDSSHDQYYMVNTDEKGLPIAYIPAR